jgi:NTE family protein
VEERDGENVLVVDASEKNWGPGYLNFQLGFSDDFESSSNYNVGMSYTLTNVNDWGGEWLTEASLGTAKHLKTDFYTPLEPSQTYFGETSLAYDKTQRRVFFPEESRSSSGVSYLDSEYSFTSVDLAVGWNRQPWSRFSLGLEGKIGSVEIQNSPTRMPMPPPGDPTSASSTTPSTAATSPIRGLLGHQGWLLLRRLDPADAPPSRPRG